MAHRTRDTLEAGVPGLLAAPAEAGTLALLVRRPAPGKREVLAEGRLLAGAGLDGDRWADGPRRADAQVNVMSHRMVALLADEPEGQALAGDQLYVDLDLSVASLPAGSRIQVGEAVLEVSARPHNGCRKFLDRFGEEATEFVNSEQGRALRLRGLNARVVTGGVVRTGDPVTRLVSPSAPRS